MPKINIPTPLKYLKEKYYNIGHQEGHQSGYELGQKDGFDVGYSKGEEIGFNKGKENNRKQVDLYMDTFNKLWENQENELNELREYKNKSIKSKSTVTQNKSEKELIDEHMLFFKSISEIIDTSFFSTVLYQNSNSSDIKELITYTDYLEHSIDIKTTYPETSIMLPKLKLAYEKLYENKLAIEEAEKFS